MDHSHTLKIKLFHDRLLLPRIDFSSFLKVLGMRCGSPTALCPASPAVCIQLLASLPQLSERFFSGAA